MDNLLKTYEMVLPFVAVGISGFTACASRWLYKLIDPVDTMYQSALGASLFCVWALITIYAVGIIAAVWNTPKAK